MSDDDLIRRGDALAMTRDPFGAETVTSQAIAALPARGVGVPDEQAFMSAVWDALKADATDLGKQQRILFAFRAALAPTDAAHVNEAPKSEHDGADVLTDAAQAREEALREVLAAMKAKVVACDSPDELRGLCLGEAAILALLSEDRT